MTLSPIAPRTGANRRPHVQCLAGIFPFIRQHVAPEDRHLHSVVAAPLDGLLSHTQLEIHHGKLPIQVEALGTNLNGGG